MAETRTLVRLGIVGLAALVFILGIAFLATKAKAGAPRPANNAYFPAGGCDQSLVKDASEFVAIRYEYLDGVLRRTSSLIKPEACTYVPREHFATLQAWCYVYRRERFAPDEPLRRLGPVKPEYVTQAQLNQKCAGR